MPSQAYVITVPFIHDPLIGVLFTFLAVFVGVRVVIRLWDLVGV